jgi:hypothetical protein
MQSKACNAILPLKPGTTPVMSSEELIKNTLECITDISKEKKSKTKNKEETPKDLSEKDVMEYLSEKKDNIILVFGQKIQLAHRNDIKKNLKKDENIFTDESDKKYFQINGRHLIEEDDIKYIKNSNFSIFNISTLKNVVRTTTKGSPIKHSRSVYSVDAYNKDEYNEMLKE